MISRVLSLIIITILLLSSQSHSITVSDITKGGYARKLFISGNYLYLADWHSGLHIVDFSDPYRPFRIGGLDTKGITSYVVVEGNHAFLADRKNGIEIVDVSDSSRPRLIARYKTREIPKAIAFSNGNIFIAEGEGWLEKVDVSNIEMPVKVDEFRANSISGISINESFAYASDNDRLLILDISDPKFIKKIKTKKVGYNIRNISVINDRMYITGSTKISLFNITDADNPVLSREYEIDDGVSNIFIGEDGNIYMAAGSDGLRVLLID